jgi:poly(beta-D-mannuronate) lyase
VALATVSPRDAGAAEHRVATAAELVRVTSQLKPGDTVVFADGVWRNQEVLIRAKGTAEQPVTFRAQTPGKVVITGQGSIDIDGEHLIVSGLSVHAGEAAKEGIAIRGHHCRVTDCSVTDSTYKFFVRLFGSHNRLDHCYLGGKANDSPTMQVECPGEPNWHRIDHNHFGPRRPLGRNGGETIRIGYSHQSMNESRTTVEDNLFDQCDGELEIISNKSCDNVYRGNTFFECAGMLTLRHGNRCRVEGNFFFGAGKKGSGGIRVIGEDHVVVNNYIDAVDHGGFWITSGIPNSPLVGYFQARNCLIAFNTVVNSRGACIEVAAGLGSSGRTLVPENITVANNLFAVPSGGTLIKGSEDRGYRWVGNIVTTLAGAKERAGIRVADLSLVIGTDGITRLNGQSAGLCTAEGEFPQVTLDIEGQPRVPPIGVGCDQQSTATAAKHALKAGDVGPGWRRAKDSTIGG